MQALKTEWVGKIYIPYAGKVGKMLLRLGKHNFIIKIVLFDKDSGTEITIITAYIISSSSEYG